MTWVLGKTYRSMRNVIFEQPVSETADNNTMNNKCGQFLFCFKQCSRHPKLNSNGVNVIFAHHKPALKVTQ